MNFNSLSYLLFLSLNVLLYYLLPVKFRNIQLLAASYFFYCCWSPKYALLILFSTVTTYLCALLTGRAFLSKRRLWVILGAALNLLLLFFFKYFNFLSSLLTRLFSALGLSLSLPLLDILLPVGISFYTFQALGYLIDVYREKEAAEKNFLHYALFVSFFPQLVAGPIERSENMLRQIRTPHPFRAENLRDGALPILWGLFKKMVLADQLAVPVNRAYQAPQLRSGAELLLATLAFAFQIYCDFSAYSDIARGSAKLLGFDLMENFRCPYLSQSVKEFWKRWHISLSSWFRDYLYFPLGGSRCSKGRQIFNLFVVFALSGLWHGAALTFLFWGLLNGLYQALGVLWAGARKALLKRESVKRKFTLHKIVFTFFLILLSWVLFRAGSLSDALLIYRAIFSIPFSGFSVSLKSLELSWESLILLGGCVLLLTAVDWAAEYRQLAKRINESFLPRYAVYFFLIAAILLFGSYGKGYSPQDFVYFQF